MTAHFLACDKDSSDSFQRTVHVKDEAELREEWKKFEKGVPFARWYHDNTADDEATEELVRDL
jgi:hypothetical protein